MSADFMPTLRGYSEMRPFRFWCQKVIPLVYDNSLSYYELLCKVVEYLNTVMSDVDVTIENIEILNQAMKDLKDYVDNYFETTDFTDKIDEEIDKLVESGYFDEALQALIDAALIEYDDRISAIETELSDYDTVTAQVQTNTGDIGLLQDDVSSLKSRMNDAEGDISENARDIGTLEGDVTNLDGRLDTVESSVGTHGDDISSLKNRMTTAETDIDVLEVNAGGINLIPSAEAHGMAYEDKVWQTNSMQKFTNTNTNKSIGDETWEHLFESHNKINSDSLDTDTPALPIYGSNIAFEAVVDNLTNPGGVSFELKNFVHNYAITFTSTEDCPSFIRTANAIYLDPTHKYMFGMVYANNNTGNLSRRINMVYNPQVFCANHMPWQQKGNELKYIPVAQSTYTTHMYVYAIYDYPNVDEYHAWKKALGFGADQSAAGSPTYAVKTSGQKIWVDGLTWIDLTEIYGEGNEPDSDVLLNAFYNYMMNKTNRKLTVINGEVVNRYVTPSYSKGDENHWHYVTQNAITDYMYRYGQKLNLRDDAFRMYNGSGYVYKYTNVDYNSMSMVAALKFYAELMAHRYYKYFSTIFARIESYGRTQFTQNLYNVGMATSGGSLQPVTYGHVCGFKGGMLAAGRGSNLADDKELRTGIFDAITAKGRHIVACYFNLDGDTYSRATIRSQIMHYADDMIDADDATLAVSATYGELYNALNDADNKMVFAVWNMTQDPKCYRAIPMDEIENIDLVHYSYSTGTKNTRYRAASVSKIITALVADELIPDEQQMIEVNDAATERGTGVDLLHGGEIVTADNLMYLMAMNSDNTAAQALFEFCGEKLIGKMFTC